MVGSLVGMESIGLPGLGLAVLLTYVVYYPLVWLAVRRDLPLRITPSQLVLIVTTALAFGVQALPAVGLAALRQPLAAALALVWMGAAGIAARSILRRRNLGAHRTPGGSGRPEDRTGDPAVDAPEPGGA
jgi:hypothetical protein